MSRDDRRAGSWPRRLAAAVAATVLFLMVPAGPAGADEEESTQSSVLVEQAVALIANDGGDERVAERIQDAVDAPDTRGVDLAKVEQALAVIDAPGEDPTATSRARTLLLDSLGGTLPSAPEDGQQATGTETGTSVILDEFRSSWGISDGGDAVLLGLSLAAIMAGLYLARRLRPPHTLHQLTHPAEHPKEER